MEAVMYGAGSIGRGFIGALLSEIGYEVVFIDVNEQVVQLINTEKKYPQIIMNGTNEIHWITHIRAVNGRDIEAASEEIASADIIATAVGASVLERISPVIAKGLMKRWNQNPDNPIDLLICENLMDADILFRNLLKKELPSNYHEIMEKNLGLVETSIGRMVPPTNPESASKQEHPLAVHVEAYDFLPVDKAAFKNEIPNYKKLIPYEPFHYYLERKLYIHNMAHVTTAFLGRLCGLTYIDEAASDLRIRYIVQGCMTESALMLSQKYNIDFVSLQNHMDDLLYRFQNPYLKDTIERVAREPIRKLQPSDRLIGAARSCEAGQITPVYLSFAAALALHFLENEDIPKFLEDVCRVKKEEPLFAHIMSFYQLLSNDDISLESIIQEIEKCKADIRGETI